MRLLNFHPYFSFVGRNDMKSSNIGGQAVLEGIMMKNGNSYAVAVRKPDGEIEVKTEKVQEGRFAKAKKIPFVRGVFQFEQPF